MKKTFFKKRIYFLYAILCLFIIILLSFSFVVNTTSATFNNNFNEAIILSFNTDTTKNSNVYKWWHKAIYDNYKNPLDSSLSFIQKQKHSFDDSGQTPSGWAQSETIPPSDNKLDLLSYTNDKTSDFPAYPPTLNSEFNGYYSGGRTDIFGMNFGLVANLNYRVLTKDESNNNVFGWNYSFNIKGDNIFSDIANTNSGSDTPKNYHYNPKITDYNTAWKNDFDYYQLWNKTLTNPGTINYPDTSDTNPSYPTNLNDDDRKLWLYNHPNNDQPPSNTPKALEVPFTISDSGNTYTILTFIIPEGQTDKILTEYTVNDEDKIYLLNDTIYSENKKNSSQDNAKYWTNDGYLFAQKMLPYWTQKGETQINRNLPNFDQNWLSFLKNGIFPTGLTDNNQYELVQSRDKYITRNQSKSLLSNNLFNYTSETYKDFGDDLLNNLDNNGVEVSKFVSLQQYSATPNITFDDDYNNVDNLKYNFLLMRGPSKYSGDNDLPDTFNSFNPYSYYCAIVGGHTDANFENSNNYFLNFIVSSCNESTTSNLNGNTYTYDSDSNITINDNNNDVINKLPTLSNLNTKKSFQSWIIVLIVLAFVLIALIFLYIYNKNKKLKKWRLKEQELLENKKTFFKMEIDKKHQNNEKK